ncbi:hypothetical protein BLL40_15810 [Domibacillus mangrovi]|uniref:Uncharacterized protein n=2 Tax=Domibacillus mangrovi TaxID=1714354 RepID=A0A1Q5NZJ8_9BACI|nr:hypothetical protein BLL40_15810 [Domibacillus mangrovi]
MVTTSRIADIAEETSLKVSLDHTLGFGIACYDSGMVEVLRDIAMEELETLTEGVPMTVHTRELTEETEKSYQAIYNGLDQKEKELLHDFQDKFYDMLLAEVGDHFIHGFVQGYRYLKNRIAYTSGYEIYEGGRKS